MYVFCGEKKVIDKIKKTVDYNEINIFHLSLLKNKKYIYCKSFQSILIMKKLYLLLFCLSFYSCEDPGPCEASFFSDEFLSYTFYKTGSTWVYKDDFHNVADTVTLVYSTVEYDDECTTDRMPEEIMKQQYSSTFFQASGRDTIITSSATYQTFNENYKVPMGYYSDFVNEPKGDYGLDSIQIQGHWYRDIKVFKIYAGEAVWAKNVGLIRKTIEYPYGSDSIYTFELVNVDLK